MPVCLSLSLYVLALLCFVCSFCPVFLSVFPSVFLSVRPSVLPSVCLSWCLSVCLCLSLCLLFSFAQLCQFIRPCPRRYLSACLFHVFFPSVWPVFSVPVSVGYSVSLSSGLCLSVSASVFQARDRMLQWHSCLSFYEAFSLNPTQSI